MPDTNDRPWIVTGKTHEHEWNGTYGRRFHYEQRARAFAEWMTYEGYWDVQVRHADGILVDCSCDEPNCKRQVLIEV